MLWDRKTFFEISIKMSVENNIRANHMKFLFLQVRDSCIYRQFSMAQTNTFPSNDNSVFWHDGKCQTCISFQV